MTFGIPSLSSQKFDYDLNRNQIMGYAIMVTEQLDWGIFKLDDDILIAELLPDGVEDVYLLDITAEPQKLFVKGSISKGSDKNPDVNEKNITQFIEKFNELKDTIAKEEAAEKFRVVKEHIENGENEPKTSIKEKVEAFFNLFKPDGEYFFTPILALINIFIFIAMVLSGVDFFTPTSEAIINWGGNFAPQTQTGEWWRLITSNFLHIGIFHLAFNMWALIYAGALLEPMIGKVKFLLAYLLTGLSSGIVSLFFHSNNVSAGASGAIFGLFGVLLALLLTNFVDRRVRNSILGSIALFIGANLLYGMQDGIDNAGHIGGLIGGFIIGFSFYPLLIKPREKVAENSILSIISALFIGLCFVAFSIIPKSENGRYHELATEFFELEQEALEVYSKFETASANYILFYLEDKGVKNWERGIQIAKEAQNLEIDNRLKKYAKGLEAYSNYRKESYLLLIKAIKNDTDIYDNELEMYNTKIDSVLSVLQKY